MPQASPGTNGGPSSLLPYLGLLVQHLSADWPRRGRSLLEIGCGDGQVLEILWTLGFDISGLEHDPNSADAARALLGGRTDIQLGAYDHLPYEDDSFDYVVLVKVFEQHLDLNALLREAVRVAARNLLLIFPNTWSLSWAATRLPGRKQPLLTAYSPFAILRGLRLACQTCGFRLRSILPGPPSTWAADSAWRHVNSRLLPLPFGSFVGIRLDLAPLKPVTGLPLRVKAPCMSVPGASVMGSYGGCRCPGRSGGENLHPKNCTNRA